MQIKYCKSRIQNLALYSVKYFNNINQYFSYSYSKTKPENDNKEFPWGLYLAR